MALDYNFNVNSLIQSGRTTREDIDELRSWINNTHPPNVPDLTDQQLVVFLLSCDNEKNLTHKTIIEHYKAKFEGPELFTDRDVRREELRKQMATLYYAVCPKRTPDGAVILLHKLKDFSYGNYNQPDAIKLLFMSLDAALLGEPPNGLYMLFDMQGVGIMHLTRIRLGALRKMLHFVQDGLTLKLKAIHVLNTQYFIDKIMAIMKPFMKKELMELLHFHHPDMDMNEFFEKYIPAECMPKEYGGELPSSDSLQEDLSKKLVEMMSFFEAEEKQRSSFRK